MPFSAKTLVLVNPTSGGGRAGRVAPLVADYLREQGAPAEFEESQSAEDLEQRAAGAAARGFSHVVALGGDGALHYVVNGVVAAGGTAEVTLGFFPAGNGNDIAIGLGIPTDPLEAAHAFLRMPARKVDVLRARCAVSCEPRWRQGGRVYIGTGGMGLDAEAARLVQGKFKRLPGVVRYVAATLWALTSFAPLDAQVEIDTSADGLRASSEPWRGPVLFAAVANSPCYGAGVKIEPSARMDDGWLNLVLVGDMPWTQLFEAIPPILRNGDLRWPEIVRRRARRVKLSADRPAFFHGDGELLGETPVEIEVLPGAIQVRGVRTSESS